MGMELMMREKKKRGREKKRIIFFGEKDVEILACATWEKLI